AAVGDAEPQHPRQPLLGLISAETFSVHGQIAALALQEALAQLPLLRAMAEAQLHLRRGAGIAPGAQVGQGAGAVPFEEGRANGAHQGTLARFVGPADQVEPGTEAADAQGLAKLPKLTDAQLLQLHGVLPPACRSRSNPASSPSASRAVSGCSPC